MFEIFDFFLKFYILFVFDEIGGTFGVPKMNLMGMRLIPRILLLLIPGTILLIIPISATLNILFISILILRPTMIFVIDFERLFVLG